MKEALVYYFKKNMMTENVLKLSLGIDVSKERLSFSLGVLQSDLSKVFIQKIDVCNNTSGFRKISDK